MVWAIRNASGFGDFFPQGQYFGYEEKLEAYYINEMTDAEKVEMEMQDRLLYSKFSAKFFRDMGPLKPHEWPIEFRAEKTYKALGSLTMLNYGLLAVDEVLKNIIEKLEPNLHQFSPINIIMPNSKEYPKQYYAMVVAQFLDSFSPALSQVEAWRDDSFEAHWGEKITQYSVDIPKKQYFSGLAMNSKDFGGSHLWRERKLKDPDIYLSDDLVSEIKNQGLRTPTIYQLKEV